jgi:hypothetical protein
VVGIAASSMYPFVAIMKPTLTADTTIYLLTMQERKNNIDNRRHDLREFRMQSNLQDKSLGIRLQKTLHSPLRLESSRSVPPLILISVVRIMSADVLFPLTDSTTHTSIERPRSTSLDYVEACFGNQVSSHYFTWTFITIECCNNVVWQL